MNRLRLKQPAEFAAVFASRRMVRGENFELRLSPNHGDSPRLGLVIPKRLARRSVMRNLIKRLAREAFRQALPKLPMFDMVLRLTRKPAEGALSDRGVRRAWRVEIDALLIRAAP